MRETTHEQARAAFLDDHVIRHSMIREYTQPDKKAMRQAEMDERLKGFAVKEFP